MDWPRRLNFIQGKLAPLTFSSSQYSFSSSWNPHFSPPASLSLDAYECDLITLYFADRMKHYQNPIVSCTLNVLMGCPNPIDMVKISFPEKTIYSLLSIGWGLIADIDIESEGLRFLGHSRFTLWAIYRSLGTQPTRCT